MFPDRVVAAAAGGAQRANGPSISTEQMHCRNLREVRVSRLMSAMAGSRSGFKQLVLFPSDLPGARALRRGDTNWNRVTHKVRGSNGFGFHFSNLFLRMPWLP